MSTRRLFISHDWHPGADPNQLIVLEKCRDCPECLAYDDECSLMFQGVYDDLDSFPKFCPLPILSYPGTKRQFKKGE
jgi:hypothetical protein